MFQRFLGTDRYTSRFSTVYLYNSTGRATLFETLALVPGAITIGWILGQLPLPPTMSTSIATIVGCVSYLLVVVVMLPYRVMPPSARYIGLTQILWLGLSLIVDMQKNIWFSWGCYAMVALLVIAIIEALPFYQEEIRNFGRIQPRELVAWGWLGMLLKLPVPKPKRAE